jgi:RNA polymerase sigma-70 factor (ECF subfamily)
MYSARAELFRKSGRTADAVESYRRALTLSRQEPQRRFLEQRIAQLVKGTGVVCR